MYADLSATTTVHWPCRWLLCAVLMLGCASAWGETYQAQDESLHTFFTALSVPFGLPIVVSREAARRRISGTYDFGNARQVLEAVARQYGLIWHSDGQVLHLYDAGEAKSSAVALRHISVEKLTGLMRRSGLDDSRHPLRQSGERMFYVTGPSNYVDQVLRLAQTLDRPQADLRVGPHTFGVVQVFNTHVADRRYAMGDDHVNVPGVASMIETLLANERRRNPQPANDMLADKSLSVFAYPDTNSLLIKGTPAQVRFIERLVAELDMPKRAIEVSLWLVDVDSEELKKMEMGWPDEANPSAAATRVLEPSEDNRFMALVTALERRRRARVVTLPVILAQENVPAVFQDNQTFYLPRPGEDGGDWQPVRYGTQVSVLPRFTHGNEIEMQINAVDGQQLGKGRNRKQSPVVGNVGISTVIRVPQGRRLWIGGFQRDAESLARGKVASRGGEVRLFVIQARAVGHEPRTLNGAVGPPLLTQAQYERVQRAFVRPVAKPFNDRQPTGGSIEGERHEVYLDSDAQ